jgi:hypothetical protein
VVLTSKKEWLTIVEWLKLRFSSIKWNDAEIRSLYEDYKKIDPEYIWGASQLCYENNTDFMSSAKLMSVVKELQAVPKSDNKALTMGEVMNMNKGGLLDYLKAGGYESFAHAVFDAKIKRLRSGKALPYETTHWDLEAPYSEQKDLWLQEFSPEWTLEFLERKRDKQIAGEK